MPLKPMLAKVYEHRHYRAGMLVQPKLNGVRCLYQNGQLVSRDGEVWSQSVLSHIRKELKGLHVGSNVLDGELYVHGLSLQQINSRVAVKRVEPHADEIAIELHIFDYVSRDSMLSRSVALAKLFREHTLTHVRLVPTFLTRSMLSGDKHHATFKSQGYEGTMYRDPRMPYAIVGEHPRADNRVSWLLKRKDWLDLDATIIRVIEGRDGFEGTMGSFECEYRGKRFNAGSGPTHGERAEFWSLRDRLPGCSVKLQYECLSDTGVPLKPVIIQVELP